MRHWSGFLSSLAACWVVLVIRFTKFSSPRLTSAFMVPMMTLMVCSRCRESAVSSCSVMACTTNSYVISSSRMRSDAWALWRKSRSASSGYLEASAVTISCTYCSTLRALTRLVVPSSSCCRTRSASLSAANTSGGSVNWMRRVPPCPKFLRATLRIWNMRSVSSLAISGTSRATRCCSSTNWSASSSSSAGASSASLTSGPTNANSAATVSGESSPSPFPSSTRRSSRTATDRRVDHCKKLISAGYSDSSNTRSPSASSGTVSSSVAGRSAASSSLPPATDASSRAQKPRMSLKYDSWLG
mmetsp:Transcript_8988/g.28406  ORF Transcript_8988/g.28406 Transcript_8988/m.28406 type:complete len:301 (-) Transcript_8988:1116-2018(-)